MSQQSSMAKFMKVTSCYQTEGNDSGENVKTQALGIVQSEQMSPPWKRKNAEKRERICVNTDQWV
jgi:hypothetical protein